LDHPSGTFDSAHTGGDGRPQGVPLKDRLTVNINDEVSSGGQYLEPTTRKPRLQAVGVLEGWPFPCREDATNVHFTSNAKPASGKR
jgi:hypothetical protein